jgi:Uma2 family endonuclease
MSRLHSWLKTLRNKIAVFGVYLQDQYFSEMLDTRLRPIVKSPDMPKLIRDLQAIWENEQQRRLEFYDWVTPDMKAEFIDGEIIVHSPVRKKHNAITGWLYSLLNVYVMKHDLGFVGIEKIMTRFERNDYEPDIVFFGKEKAGTLEDDQTIFPVPDFIVEVISDSTEARDRGVKFLDYALHGVGEYWIIDPETETVEQYLLQEGEYVLKATLVKGSLESMVIKGFQIPVRAIFDREAQLKALGEIS